MKCSVLAAAVGAALVTGLVAGVGASAAFDFSGCSVPQFSYLFNGRAVAVQPSDIVAGDPNVIVCNGTSYAPIRYVARALGATVSWDQSTLTASIALGNGVNNPPRSSTSPAPSSPAPTNSRPATWNSQGITYTNATVALDPTDGSPTVDLQAINTTAGDLGIAFTVSFFDASGKLLGTADGADMDIPAGQTKTEEAAGLSSVAGWKTVSIQTDEAVAAGG